MISSLSPICQYASSTPVQPIDHRSGVSKHTIPEILECNLVVRKLKLRYPWTNALCTIQDDPEDWAGEAARRFSTAAGNDITYRTLRKYSVRYCSLPLHSPWAHGRQSGVLVPKHSSSSMEHFVKSDISGSCNWKKLWRIFCLAS